MAGCSTGAYGMAFDGSASGSVRRKDSRVAWATALYGAHYDALVRLAALLIGDVAVAERVVQDAFVALYHSRRRQDSDRELFYLRRAVIRRSRSAGRRATVLADTSQPVLCRAIGRQHGTEASQGYSAMISALSRLPARQREAVLLRYYSELPEEQIASIMGLSRRAVARLLERAGVSLRPPAGAARRSAQPKDFP
jgi:RNA polymerase sigma factor (sigma-70 family)